jgi:hypothetical protein
MGDFMKKVKISDEYSLEVGKKIKFSASEKTTVVCFENNFSEEKYYLGLLNQENIDKVILIGARPRTNFGKKLIVTNRIKSNLIKNSEKLTFIINTDIDEDVLIPLVQLFRIARRKNIGIGLGDVVGFSYKTNIDLMKTLEALLQEDLYKQYEVIYDYICDELDKKFADNSICQFEDNRCIANRKYYDKGRIMGCCYSFKYNGWHFSDVKLCEHQKEQKCNVKCLGCKLFTCDYLRKRGIRFTLNKMPVALAFFSKKQREILRTTFFVEKEIVIEKVIKEK